MKSRVFAQHTSGDFGKQLITLSPIAFTILASKHSAQAQAIIFVYER